MVDDDPAHRRTLQCSSISARFLWQCLCTASTERARRSHLRRPCCAAGPAAPGRPAAPTCRRRRTPGTQHYAARAAAAAGSFTLCTRPQAAGAPPTFCRARPGFALPALLHSLRAPPTCTQMARRKVEPSRGTSAAAMAASARCASAARSAPSAAVTSSSYMNAWRAAGGTRASRCASACSHCAPRAHASPLQPLQRRRRRRPGGRPPSAGQPVSTMMGASPPGSAAHQLALLPTAASSQHSRASTRSEPHTQCATAGRTTPAARLALRRRLWSLCLQHGLRLYPHCSCLRDSETHAPPTTSQTRRRRASARSGPQSARAGAARRRRAAPRRPPPAPPRRAPAPAAPAAAPCTAERPRPAPTAQADSAISEPDVAAQGQAGPASISSMRGHSTAHGCNCDCMGRSRHLCCVSRHVPCAPCAPAYGTPQTHPGGCSQSTLIRRSVRPSMCCHQRVCLA